MDDASREILRRSGVAYRISQYVEGPMKEPLTYSVQATVTDAEGTLITRSLLDQHELSQENLAEFQAVIMKGAAVISDELQKLGRAKAGKGKGKK